MTQSQIEPTEENYWKVVEKRDHYEDMIICSECKEDREAAKKEFEYWDDHEKALYKALYFHF